ncbi:MAG TPA: Asp23/Gls24 family envelope stress response protein [Chloroflexia bacterium]|nr:Asp23/Gls24 family envelope stress response protein [Chloroflexia bacterium]
MASRQRRDQHNLDRRGSSLSLDGAAALAGAATAAAPGELPAVAGRKAATAPESAGKIEVSPRAIAHLASRAAQRSYGVVGLASRHARPGLAELLRREEISKGVDVSFSDGQVVVDLYVVLEYGVRISEVARNIMSNVKFALESSLGVPVVNVNVNVQGIRVSEQV